jgi:hypothetical protein
MVFYNLEGAIRLGRIENVPGARIGGEVRELHPNYVVLL